MSASAPTSPAGGAAITPAYANTMARYNTWQNRSLFAAADGLDDVARKQDRGAFFGSIHATLSHLVFGDQIWMHRLSGSPPPRAKTVAESATAIPDWGDLKRERVAMDAAIEAWTKTLDSAWLADDLEWFSGVARRTFSRPKWLLVAHMFNHQTHHRGQVHAMLTAAGAKPDDTDLVFMDS